MASRSKKKRATRDGDGSTKTPTQASGGDAAAPFVFEREINSGPRCPSCGAGWPAFEPSDETCKACM